MMKRNISGDILYLTFPELEKYKFIKHAFSTRLGGVSQNEFASMNLGFNRGDSRENVLENYRRMCAACDFDLNSLVASRQEHKTNIRKVSKPDCETGITKNCFENDADGLITNESGVTLVTYFADCVPLFFVDIKKKVIALSHAGWRGTVNLIAAKTLQKFQKEYSSNLNDIICAIGPSIGKCCYEVDEDVKNKFIELKLEAPLFAENASHKFMLDLWLANEAILLQSGIPAHNIIRANMCTACNSDLLFSHRVTNGKRGTLAAFLCLV